MTGPPSAIAIRSSTDTPRVLDSIELAAVGDVLLHVPVHNAARQAGGYDRLFASVRDSLSAADITFANLETPIAPLTGGPSKPFVFNSPPSVLGALKRAGIDVVSYANNHVYDQGRAGLIETLQHLEASKLEVVGAGRTCQAATQARMLESGTFWVAFIGAAMHFNGNALNAGADQPCAARFDEDTIIASTRAARAAGADLVVLSVHWGAEYQTVPASQDVELAHRLVEAGVDIILGHHPHVLQPVEVFETSDGRQTIIAYSLGNFISNQSYLYTRDAHRNNDGNKRDGLLLRVRVERVDDGKRVYTRLAGLSAQPLWTHNNYLEMLRRPVPRWIHVVDINEALRELDLRVGPERVRGETKRERALLRTRRYQISRVVGSDVLQKVAD